MEMAPHGQWHKRPKVNVTTSHPHTGEAKMKSTTTVLGVDIAKRVVQLHRVESNTGEFKGLTRTRAQLFDHVVPIAPRVEWR